VATVILAPTPTGTRGAPTLTATATATATTVPVVPRWQPPQQAGLDGSALWKLALAMVVLGGLSLLWMRSMGLAAARILRAELAGAAGALGWYVMVALATGFLLPRLGQGGMMSRAAVLATVGGLVLNGLLQWVSVVTSRGAQRDAHGGPGD
jgi:hypothetical protein